MSAPNLENFTLQNDMRHSDVNGRLLGRVDHSGACGVAGGLSGRHGAREERVEVVVVVVVV